MDVYSLEGLVHVEVQAPSLEDARQALEDIMGVGEMEAFDMNVTHLSIKEI